MAPKKSKTRPTRRKPVKDPEIIREYDGLKLMPSQEQAQSTSATYSGVGSAAPPRAQTALSQTALSPSQEDTRTDSVKGHAFEHSVDLNNKSNINKNDIGAYTGSRGAGALTSPSPERSHASSIKSNAENDACARNVEEDNSSSDKRDEEAEYHHGGKRRRVSVISLSSGKSEEETSKEMDGGDDQEDLPHVLLQKCPYCSFIFEKVQDGHNYVECRCGAEWCHTCTLAWKSCPCPLLGGPLPEPQWPFIHAPRANAILLSKCLLGDRDVHDVLFNPRHHLYGKPGAWPYLVNKTRQ